VNPRANSLRKDTDPARWSFVKGGHRLIETVARTNFVERDHVAIKNFTTNAEYPGEVVIGREERVQPIEHRRHHIACPRGRVCYAAGAGGTIVATTDGGRTWRRQATGTANALYSIACPGAGTCYAVGDVGTIVATTNGGRGWAMQASPSSDRWTGIACPNRTICYIAGGAETSQRGMGGFEEMPQIEATRPYRMRDDAPTHDAWARPMSGTSLALQFVLRLPVGDPPGAAGAAELEAVRARPVAAVGRARPEVAASIAERPDGIPSTPPIVS